MRQTENDDLIAHSKVLIVEDEYHTRKTLRALLRAMGATRVYEAPDGESGVEAVCALDPDVVLLDWNMPDMSGEEFLRRLHADGAFAQGSVPIIMLTGHGERMRVLDAVRHGVHEFLLKPVSRGALKARLHSALENAAETALRHKPSAPRKLAS